MKGLGRVFPCLKIALVTEFNPSNQSPLTVVLSYDSEKMSDCEASIWFLRKQVLVFLALGIVRSQMNV